MLKIYQSIKNPYSIFGSKTNSFFNFFVYLYILAYVAGPAIINIYLLIVGTFALFNNIKIKLKLKSLDYILLIFLFYIFFKDLFYEKFDPHIFVLFNFINIFIYFNNLFDHDDVHFFIFPAIIIILVISLDSIYQYFLGYNLLGFPKFDYYRLTSFFYNEPIVGSFLMKFFIPCLLIYLKFNLTNKKKIFYFFSCFLFFYVIFLSGERLALIQSSILFFIFLFYFLIKFTPSKILYILIPIIFLISISINDNLKNRIYDTSKEFIYFFNNYNSLNVDKLGSLKNYYNNFQSGLKYWEYNKLFGSGYRSYNKDCSEILKNNIYLKGCSTHPHNIYIETLADHGLVGFGLFTIFLLIIILKNYNLNNGFNFVFYMMIVPFFPSQSFYSSYYQSIFLLILILSLIKKKDIKI